MPSQPLTWENIKSLDDVVPQTERDMTARIMTKSKGSCPLLRKDGEHFYFCGDDIPEGTKAKLEPFDPIYRAHQSASEIMVWCAGGYEKCASYKQSLKKEEKPEEPQ